MQPPSQWKDNSYESVQDMLPDNPENAFANRLAAAEIVTVIDP